MKPYYERNGIVIYHADAREVLPQLESVGLLLTDPPYGIDGGRGGGNRQRGKGKYDTELWEDTPEYIVAVCVPIVEAGIVLAERGIVTPGNRNMALYPIPRDYGCFWTPAGIGQSPWGLTSFNVILFYGRDPRAGIGSLPTGKSVTETPGIQGHPCPKPLGAWQWLLSKGSTDTGEIVLDPFMGAGTTLRAAKNLGHPAIGIDIEERYCEIAANRLAQEVML